MKKLYYLLFCLLMLPGLARAQKEGLIAGTVQAESGIPLPGATVFIKGTYLGSSTNEEGQFQLKANFDNGPVVLSVGFVGYETQDVPLSAPDNALSVVLKPSTLLAAVVVSASRVAENIGQVPVTVEKIDQRQVEQLATPDLVAGLGRFKGIDVSASSLLATSFSTRGFNSSRSERIIQLADYMDTQVPSISSNFGNLLGMPVLDVASVEVVHGPASALYGANAFNGVLLTTSKDPFNSPGLTVRLRGGNRDYLDGQLRYAVKLGERVAFKISGSAVVADDFLANNYSATSKVIETQNNEPGFGAGYDAVSKYGDINTGYNFISVLVNPATRTPYVYPAGHPRAGQPIPTPASLVGKSLFLPGFTESDLVVGDERTESYKVAPSLSVLLTNSVKATVDYKYARGNTSYQSASRYRFINSGAHQGRAQLEGRNWFLRAYTTRDFSGGRDPQTDGSYNLGFLGGFLQNQLVPNSTSVTYGQRYVGTYLGTLAGALSQSADPEVAVRAAQAAAAPTQLQPGTAEFTEARNRLIHDTTPGKGARLVLRSMLNDGSGQYTFNNSIANLTVGAAYRQYQLGSDGSLFEDTKEGDRIKNYEYGAYAQAIKTVLNDRLKLAVAGRVDRFQNFETAFSPRASAVYSVGADKQHNFRTSYSRAFRAPTQNDQYIRLDVGRAILLGNVVNGFQGYKLQNDANQSFASQLPGILAPTRSADLAAFQYNASRLKLEEVNSYEVGYRAQLIEKLYVDVDYYYNTYNNFIATQNFIGNTDGTQPSNAQIAAAATTTPSFGPTLTGGATNPTRVIQIAANVDQRVQSHGAGLTLSYAFAPALTVNGNYSFNDLITKDFKAGTQSFFNTPRHKFNLGLDGQTLERKLSYNLNYRWVDAYLYESTFATGELPVTHTLDAQVGYTLKSLHTTVQLGGSNLFDSSNTQVYGAPNIGRIVYAGLLFDLPK